MLDSITQDLRYAARKLWSSPGFTWPAVLVLGLGIGATVAMFSILHAVVLEPLPFHQPDRLARLYHLSEEWSRVPSSLGHFLTFQEQAESLEAVVAFRDRSATVAGPAGPEQLRGVWTLGPLFDLFGIPVASGRGPAARDHDPAAPPVIVLSHSASQRLLDPDQDPVGQSVRVDGEALTVIGIAPPGFSIPDRDVDFWRPAQGWSRESYTSILTTIVRLAPEVSTDQAVAELSLISQQLRASNPEAELGEVVLQPLQDSIIQPVKRPLLLLMGAGGLVLLIACANVANLLLARAVGRRHEMAVRRALGAARLRLVRQLLTESLLLAAMGAALGITAAALGLQALLTFFGDRLPRSEAIVLDGNALAFALVVSLLATLLFGVTPCLSLSRAGRRDHSMDLAGGSRTSRRLAPQLLVVAQTGLAVMLLVGAGLLLRSLQETLAVDPGFRTGNGLSFTVGLAGSSGEDEAAPLRFHERLQERLASQPGVEEVARASFLPLNRRTGWASWIHIAGRAEDEGVFLYRLVSTNYFSVIGSRRLTGRLFEEGDRTSGRPVVVINESMSRRLWPAGDALGAVLTLGAPEDPLVADATVIGVVSDARDLELGEAPRPVLYAPHDLVPWYRTFHYVVRTPLAADTLIPSFRRELASLDAGVPLYRVRTLDDLVADSVAGSRASATLASLFALLALALAAAGLFGLSTYLIAQRSHELAIRMALGATAARIGRLVWRQGLVQTLAGLAVGLIGALLLTRFLDSLLFGITPFDPLALVAATLLLLLTMAAATWPLVRRASRITPLELLRED